MIKCLYPPFQHWAERGTVFIYSDPHFGDKDMPPSCKRPSAEDHVKLINSKVGKNDTLILLGDIGDVEYVKQLRGYKVLIKGNHDKGNANYEREYRDIICYDDEDIFKSLQSKYDENDMYIDYIGENHLVNVIVDNHLFDEVYDGALMIANKLMLSHEPISSPYWVNIHGHDHSGLYEKDNPLSINVCSDACGYKLLNLNEFIKKGGLSKAMNIHRATIDNATERKKNKEN